MRFITLLIPICLVTFGGCISTKSVVLENNLEFSGCHVTGELRDLTSFYFGINHYSYNYEYRISTGIKKGSRDCSSSPDELYSLFLHLNDIYNKGISGKYSGGYLAYDINISFTSCTQNVRIRVEPGAVE